MLNNLSDQTRECLEHAEDCARKAAEQPDGSRLKQDFLNLEKRWRDLSRGFHLGERPTDFINEANRKGKCADHTVLARRSIPKPFKLWQTL